jgi:TonB family protein
MKTFSVLMMTVICALCLTGTAMTGPQDMPEVKKQVAPTYPTILKEAGIEGKVLLKVLIDEQGFVAKAETVKCEHPAFAEAAITAVKQWVFTPAMKDGKPIKAEVTIPFMFKLGDKGLKSKHGNLLQLQDDIIKFLRGEAGDNVKGRVGTTAYAVVGNTYGSLTSFFSDGAKKNLLIEGPDSVVGFKRSVLGDAEDMAYLLLKTKPAPGKPERYHTVVFVKSPEGEWKISAWHAGS